MGKKYRRNISRGTMGDKSIKNVLQSAGALIFCQTTNRYLFVLRNGSSYSGSWGLVGGKINKDESVYAGLIREIVEEIGVDLSDNKVMPLEKFTSDDNSFEYHTFFICVDSEFIPTLNDEHSGYCWVPIKDYPKPLHPGLHRTISFEKVMEKLMVLSKVMSIEF